MEQRFIRLMLRSEFFVSQENQQQQTLLCQINYNFYFKKPQLCPNTEDLVKF